MRLADATASGAVTGSNTWLARAPWLLVGLAVLATYGPTLWALSTTLWRSDEHVHGPIVLVVASWLLWGRRAEIAVGAPGDRPSAAGWLVLLVTLLAFMLGRSQSIILLELGSAIGVLTSVLLLLRGPRTAALVWFPLFFMLFAVPLPAQLVDLVTGPMKIAVSSVAEQVLHLVGYPIARTGVILQIGAYQLLVADACAGLQTLFTLEALGLLYLNLVQHASLVRNVSLAILIVPISFIANVIRVIVLTLVTFHFGDEAGQGFVHDFAGMVLFVSGLLLIMGVDAMLRWVANRLPASGAAR
jgi:exosortase B